MYTTYYTYEDVYTGRFFCAIHDELWEVPFVSIMEDIYQEIVRDWYSSANIDPWKIPADVKLAMGILKYLSTPTPVPVC